jgi:very-short-patch-repair endonuclease
MNFRRTAGLRRALRSQSSDAERQLWQRLRNRQVGGYKFRRQDSVGPYVVDFFCHDALLVVEVDGAHHFESPYKERDE